MYCQRWKTFQGVESLAGLSLLLIFLSLWLSVNNILFMLPQDKPDGTLRKFYEVITQVGGEFLKTITGLKNVTLLAPSNEAWIEANLDELMK